ncbi:hypothetical protein MtrunA17_Chr2g0278881 [Medicago truncatula]|uniref:Uncharacterized protein n=1 Tax=Medicago truncatula TaxID=3880 RepID=A0A396J557_MEDTR|nr:hypothetical protein MtrunA17_Chr2g0278881 [Medicago truncatula]
MNHSPGNPLLDYCLRHHCIPRWPTCSVVTFVKEMGMTPVKLLLLRRLFWRAT